MWVVRGGLMGRSPRGLHTPWGKVWEVKSMGLHSTPGMYSLLAWVLRHPAT